MGVGIGGQGSWPWIFIHGKDIVDRGLMVLFFGLFCVGFPRNFSADALGTIDSFLFCFSCKIRF